MRLTAEWLEHPRQRLDVRSRDAIEEEAFDAGEVGVLCDPQHF